MIFCITSHFSTYFKTVFSSTFIAVLLLPVASMADNAAAGENSTQPLLEKFEKGFINWQRGEYIANVSAPVPAEYRGKAVNQAMGKELALRVSQALADSVFLQIVAETRVHAKHRLSHLVKGDSEMKLAGNIRGKKLINTKWVKRENKLWLEASYRIAMRGVDGVISYIYDQAIETRPAISPSPAKSPTSKPNKQDKNSPTVVYIDARGTGLQPALFPSIMDQQHVGLFDHADAGKSYIAENGVVEYVIANDNKTLPSFVEQRNTIIVSARPASLFSLEWLIKSSVANDATPVRKRKKRKVIKASEAGGFLK